MRVFLTGSTGYIGSVITERFLEAGHQVLGLARSDQSKSKLEAMGAEALRGDLSDLESLRLGASTAEGVVHAGWTLEGFDGLDAAFAQDRAAVEAMLSSLAGTGRPFIYTSGSGVLADTGDTAADETVPASDTGATAPRAALEQTVLNAKENGIRTIVIRPGLVYGRGGSGIWHMLAGFAREAGGGKTIGDGENVCSAVHVDDLADLYLSALERAPDGILFNAASEETVTMRDIVSAIARTLKLTKPTTAWPIEDAKGLLGPFAEGLAANKRISSKLAREVLGWHPHRASLMEELERGSYPESFKVLASRSE